MKRILICLISLLSMFNTSCKEKEVSTVSNDTTEEKATSVETTLNKRYEIDLNMDNYWEYFSNPTTEQSIKKGYFDQVSLNYENSGILFFAYYEDVKFTLQASYSFKYQEYECEGVVDLIELETRADGVCSFKYGLKEEYEKIIEEEVDATKVRNKYTFHIDSYVTHFLTITNISGKVLFSV